MARLGPRAFFQKKQAREKITSLTAYDFPFAKLIDETGIDLILVGDSLGMVLLGFDTTLPVTMEHMVHHTKAVSAGVKRALVAADMPYHSYTTPQKALQNARRLKAAGANAVKLEGGKRIAKQVQGILRAHIPVVGHLGMTPQSVSQFGGYKVQGRDKKQADAILEDARLLDKLGVFALVLECIPAVLAARITAEVRCPTIGIGAGPDTDGQILVLHDLLGFEGKVRPRFVRRYATLEDDARRAVQEYREDVAAGRFPMKEESY